MPRAETTPVVIFDLDGTLLGVNSFPLWVLFLIGGRLPGLGVRQRLQLSLRCQSRLLRRTLRGISHDELLRELQEQWRAASGSSGAALMASFEAQLLRHVRPNLASALACVAAEHIDGILATAAASDYALGLGRRLGFRHVLATAANRPPGEPGNSGTRKRDRVFALLAEHDWQARPLILLTDHRDDLPLMRECRMVYWFGAPASLPHMATAATNARFIAGRTLSGAALRDMLCSNCKGDLSNAVPPHAKAARAMTSS
jgi:phosphoserine phosphatase